MPSRHAVVDLVNQGGVLWFFGKTLTLIVFIQWCRFTLPRLRIDQLMDLAWKVLLPAGFLNLDPVRDLHHLRLHPLRRRRLGLSCWWCLFVAIN